MGSLRKLWRPARPGAFGLAAVRRGVVSGSRTVLAFAGRRREVTTDFLGSADQARRVAIQPDGKIVVAGLSTSTGTLPDVDFAVARYSGTGSLDTSFGTGGKVRTNVAGRYDAAHGLALQADGKIVLAGRVAADGGSDPDIGVVRYQSNGNVVAGQAENAGPNPDYAVVRTLADGTLDPAFGTGGKLTVDFFGAIDGAVGVGLQPDGRIVLGGAARNGSSVVFALARLVP